VDITDEHEAELPTLVSLVSKARDGDVVALMTHQDRAQVDGWLEVHGGTRDSNATLRAKVLRAQAAAAPPD
jgi:cyanophycin synthetase